MHKHRCAQLHFPLITNTIEIGKVGKHSMIIRNERQTESNPSNVVHEIHICKYIYCIINHNPSIVYFEKLH